MDRAHVGQRIWPCLEQRVPGLGRHQRRLRRRPPRCRWDDLLGLLPLFSIMKNAKSTRSAARVKTTITIQGMAATTTPAIATPSYAPSACVDPNQHSPPMTRLRHAKSTGNSQAVKKRQNQRARKFKAYATPFPRAATSPTTAKVPLRVGSGGRFMTIPGPFSVSRGQEGVLSR